MPRRNTNKYLELAQNFARDFQGSREFTSDELSKWAHENGVPKDTGELRDDHARRAIRYLRLSGPSTPMAKAAFRIVNRGWHNWEKQEITTKAIRALQKETCEKMVSAANNGNRRNEQLCSVLLERNLPSNEAMIVAFSAKSYVMLRGTLQMIETNLQSLFKSLELEMGQELERLLDSSSEQNDA